MYLSPQELKTVLRRDVVGQLTDHNDNTIITIIGESMALMRSYLANHYNMEVEFNNTGDDRNPLVLKFLKDIVAYEICTPDAIEVNEVIATRHEEAMRWLREAAKGQVLLEITNIDGDDQDEDGNPDGDYFLSNGNQRYESKF